MLYGFFDLLLIVIIGVGIVKDRGIVVDVYVGIIVVEYGVGGICFEFCQKGFGVYICYFGQLKYFFNNLFFGKMVYWFEEIMYWVGSYVLGIFKSQQLGLLMDQYSDGVGVLCVFVIGVQFVFGYI